MGGKVHGTNMSGDFQARGGLGWEKIEVSGVNQCGVEFKGRNGREV